MDDYIEGLPQLSAFINSDDTFANFRRFGLLSARILVQLQIDLTELEKKLHEIDAADAASPTMKFRLNGYENFNGWNTEQSELVSKIREKWCQYGRHAAETYPALQE